MLNCDELATPRQQQICRGEADISPELRAKYLALWERAASAGEGRRLRPAPHASGPGTEFKALVDTMNIPEPEGCSCEALRLEMDRLGVAQCRRERERLIAALRENAGKVSWIAKLAAVGPAVAAGLAFVVNPLDPIPGLFDEAVRRAEAKTVQQTATKPKASERANGKQCGTCGGTRTTARPNRAKHVAHQKLEKPAQPQWPSSQPLVFSEWKSDAERDAIGRMISPNMKRHAWLGGIIQIWVTRACDKACFGCTQGSNLAGRPGMISLDQFDAACQSLQDYPGVVGMFGGNPCMHPQFDELCQILRARIRYEQRGLWCNSLLGRGAIARITFNPSVSNLNVHMDQRAHDEFTKTWPESRPFLKGLAQDSRHSPPYVAVQDVIGDESRRWELIGNCDINRNWSAMICAVRGQLRGFFCELAGAQAMLHQDNPDWMDTGQAMPDTGVPIISGWWNRPMTAFIEQARLHCHACGIPLRGYGGLACSGDPEQFSQIHEFIARPKRQSVKVQLVTLPEQLTERQVPKVTDYIENGAL